MDANNKNRLNGISICKGCPKVTHLFFAHDSLLFYRADRQECHKLAEILEHYEAALGQKINVDKSSVFFSQNTTSEKRGEVLSILRPMQDSRHGKYLGLPSDWKIQDSSFCGNQRKGGKETIGLEGKNVVFGW